MEQGTSTVGVVSVNVAAVSLESLLVGAFCVLSSASLFLLCKRERAQHQCHWVRHACRNPLILINIIMSCSILMHWILTVYRSFQAFVYTHGGTVPANVFLSLQDTTYVLQNVTLHVSLFSFDVIMVYRAWTIWGRRLLPVLLPILLLAAAVGLCTWIMIQLSIYNPAEGNYMVIARWTMSAIIIETMILEIICSVLFTWQLLTAHMRMKIYHVNLLSILAIVVESATIYIVWSILYLIVYESNTNMNFFFEDLWAVVAGISFMLINVRVGAGWGAVNRYQTTLDPEHARNGQDLRRGSEMQFAAVTGGTTFLEDN